MDAEVHEDLRDEAGYLVGEGLDTGAQTQHPGVALDQVLGRHGFVVHLAVALLLLQLGPAQTLKLLLKTHIFKEILII